MCDVCVAESALSKGGAVIRWNDAPRNIPVVQVLATGKGAEFKPARFQIRLFSTSADPAIQAERKKLKLQPGQALPKRGQEKLVKLALSFVKRDQKRRKWSASMRTTDLAGAMGTYGFDMAWKYVPGPVKAWLRGERKLPTVAELKKHEDGE